MMTRSPELPGAPPAALASAVSLALASVCFCHSYVLRATCYGLHARSYVLGATCYVCVWDSQVFWFRIHPSSYSLLVSVAGVLN